MDKPSDYTQKWNSLELEKQFYIRYNLKHKLDR